MISEYPTEYSISGANSDMCYNEIKINKYEALSIFDKVTGRIDKLVFIFTIVVLFFHFILSIVNGGI